MIDPVRNFANVQVAGLHTSTDTSIVLVSGHGARLPAPATEGAFNLVWFNWTDFRDPADDPNREIVRCTAITTDTLTIIRAQEGTTATAKNIASKTYRMALSYTRWKEDQIGDFPGSFRAGRIAALTEKITPIADDLLMIEDSAAGNAKRRLRVGGLPAGITSGWELIRTGTFTGNTNITGLDGNADRLWMLVIRTRHTTGFYCGIRFNSDTAANYFMSYHQIGDGLLHTSSHQRGHTSIEYGGVSGTTTPMLNHYATFFIEPRSGQIRLLSFLNSFHWDVTTPYGLIDGSGLWNNTTANITTINLIQGTITAGEFFLFRRR